MYIVHLLNNTIKLKKNQHKSINNTKKAQIFCNQKKIIGMNVKNM